MGMQRRRIRVGIVFSTSGPYGTIGRELRDGALLAVETANAREDATIELVPDVVDPAGSIDAYPALTERLLAAGIRHVVGCYTSSSRKEILPGIEKYDALLWYPSHYEGFECSPNVVYGGAAPNQHVLPLVNWALPRYGRRVYCIGSNYIWAWENTRILRDLVERSAGTVLRERYLPVGDTDMRGVIAEIRETRPDFVFNTLIGDSCYAFIRAYHALGAEDPGFAAIGRPVLSCTLSEPELHAIGPGEAAGHITASVYFNSIASPENHRFVAAFTARFGTGRVTSADSEAAYLTTLLLAEALEAAGSEDIAAVKHALHRCRIAAPQGAVHIDPDNNHAWLTPRIGVARPDGAFDILWEDTAPRRPDPYLASAESASSDIPALSPLRLVRCS